MSDQIIDRSAEIKEKFAVPGRVAPVAGFPGYYVSDCGRVFSTWKQGCGKGQRKRGFRPPLPHVSEPRERTLVKSTQTAYMLVTLTEETGKLVSKQVHALVAVTYLPPRLPGQTDIRHLDGTRDNNHISNLVFGTRKENQDDRITHGTSNRGSAHGMSRLTQEQVLEILRLCNSGADAGETAKLFGVGKDYVLKNGDGLEILTR